MDNSTKAKLDHLKDQLLSKGVDAPESIEHCGLTEIDDSLLDSVQGAQVIDFGKHTKTTETVGGGGKPQNPKPQN